MYLMCCEFLAREYASVSLYQTVTGCELLSFSYVHTYCTTLFLLSSLRFNSVCSRDKMRELILEM